MAVSREALVRLASLAAGLRQMEAVMGQVAASVLVERRRGLVAFAAQEVLAAYPPIAVQVQASSALAQSTAAYSP